MERVSKRRRVPPNLLRPGRTDTGAPARADGEIILTGPTDIP